MEKKFIVTPKEEPSVTMTIRIDSEYNKKLEEIALKSGHSRNELINMAIKFSLDNIEFVDNSTKKK